MTDYNDDQVDVKAVDEKPVDLDSLDRNAVPDRVSVYERPERSFSPILLVLIVIALLIAAYFIFQFVM
jgi:hypothetical protein